MKIGNSKQRSTSKQSRLTLISTLIKYNDLDFHFLNIFACKIHFKLRIYITCPAQTKCIVVKKNYNVYK